MRLPRTVIAFGKQIPLCIVCVLGLLLHSMIISGTFVCKYMCTDNNREWCYWILGVELWVIKNVLSGREFMKMTHQTGYLLTPVPRTNTVCGHYLAIFFSWIPAIFTYRKPYCWCVCYTNWVQIIICGHSYSPYAGVNGKWSSDKFAIVEHYCILTYLR